MNPYKSPQHVDPKPRGRFNILAVLTAIYYGICVYGWLFRVNSGKAEWYELCSYIVACLLVLCIIYWGEGERNS